MTIERRQSAVAEHGRAHLQDEQQAFRHARREEQVTEAARKKVFRGSSLRRQLQEERRQKENEEAGKRRAPEKPKTTPRKTEELSPGDLIASYETPKRLKIRPPETGALGHLARQYTISLEEVQRVISEFDRATAPSGLDRQHFATELARVMDVSGMTESVADSAWQALFESAVPDESGLWLNADINAFFAWYMVNMFGDVQAASQSASTATAYELARKYGVTLRVVEAIQDKYEKYDTDRSGEIDYDEFCTMIHALLKAPRGDLPDKLLFRFFKEIDVDHSNTIDLDEFTAFWLKYFNPDPFQPNGSRSHSLKDAFYTGFNPRTAQMEARRRSIENGEQSMERVSRRVYEAPPVNPDSPPDSPREETRATTPSGRRGSAPAVPNAKALFRRMSL
jgi:hypothetical protein